MRRGIFELIEGILIGAGGILPGISGAALAVVFGIYEELTALLAHPKREWRSFLTRHWALCVGIAAGFAGFTVLLKFFFAEWTVPLVYLFSGFIAGTLPSIWRNAKRHGIGAAETLAFFLALVPLLALAAALYAGRHGGIGPFAPDGAFSRLLAANAAAAAPGSPDALSARWALSGALIGTGSLLPGFSASFVLIWFGLYEPLLEAAGSLDLPVLAQLGAGVLAAVLLLSRLVNWLYGKFHGVMSLAVLGFTIGSLVLAFPGVPSPGSIALSTALAAAGLASSLWLESRLQ